MKTFFLLAFSCFVVITSLAQDSSLQLKDYKYRTPGYRALVFSTSFSGSLIHQNTTIIDSSIYNHFQLYPSSLTYDKIVSTDRKQSSSGVSINSSYYYSYRARGYNPKQSTGNGTVQWKVDNRYFRKNNWFWQLDNSIYLQGTFDKETIHSFKSHETFGTEALTLGFGKGRIEMVRDAQMALYILKDLKVEGLINDEVDSANIYDFARLITEINNRRVFDSRRKRIYELTQIDSFLRQKGITTATDIRYFTVLNDNWSFAYNPTRSSGRDWFFHLVPQVQYARFKWNYSDNSRSENNVNVYSLMPEIGMDSYKPLSLQWQSNFSSALSWSRKSNRSKTTNYYSNGPSMESRNTRDFDVTNLYLFYGIGYYPNTRTSVNSGFSFIASYFSYGKSYQKNEISLNPSFVFAGDYFISYRTRLTASCSADYQHGLITGVAGDPTKVHQFNFNFNFGLTHAFL